MRDVIWGWVRRGITEGMMLPWWALVVRVLLHPLDFIFWRMSQTRGYQPHNDTWLISGVVYSDLMMHLLAKSQGEIYRVTRQGNTVTLEKVTNV